jgi:hypothetical protein
MALSDSGIESVHNAKLGVAGGKAGGSAEMDDQTKGKKGKKKDKKAATKSESFNKKKKKKRSDRKKEKKKAAAEEQENEGKKEDMNTITEGNGAVVRASAFHQWRNGRVSGCPVTGGPRTLGAPDKNDHKKFDSTFLGFLIGILIYFTQSALLKTSICYFRKNVLISGKNIIYPENF